MKNFLFFSLTVLVLFFTSCTKTSITPDLSIGNTEKVVADRSNEVVITASVNPQETDIENGIISFTDFDTDPTGLTIASVQNLAFTNTAGSPVLVPVDVVSFEIIIEDGILEFTNPGTSLGGLQIGLNQSLTFEE